MSLSPLSPSDIPEHIADAIRRAEVLGQPKVARAIEKAEALRQKRLGESKERKRVQDRMAQRRRYNKVKDKVKDQRKVIKRQKLEETLNSIGVDKNDFRGAELAAESVASLIGSSVPCTKKKHKINHIQHIQFPSNRYRPDRHDQDGVPPRPTWIRQGLLLWMVQLWKNCALALSANSGILRAV